MLRFVERFYSSIGFVLNNTMFEWLIAGMVLLTISATFIQLAFICKTNRNIAINGICKRFLKKNKNICDKNYKVLLKKLKTWLNFSEKKYLKLYFQNKSLYMDNIFRENISKVLLSPKSKNLFIHKIFGICLIVWNLFLIYWGYNAKALVISSAMIGIVFALLNIILISISKVMQAWSYQAGYNVCVIINTRVVFWQNVYRNNNEEIDKILASSVVQEKKSTFVNSEKSFTNANNDSNNLANQKEDLPYKEQLEKISNSFARSLDNYIVGNPNKNYSAQVEKYVSQIPIKEIFSQEENKQIDNTINRLKKHNKKTSQ